MKYYEDNLTEAVRKFDDRIPKQKRRMKVFAKAKQYVYDEDENTIIASQGRWKPTTKQKYDAWVKSTKE